MLWPPLFCVCPSTQPGVFCGQESLLCLSGEALAPSCEVWEREGGGGWGKGKGTKSGVKGKDQDASGGSQRAVLATAEAASGPLGGWG